MRITSPGRTGCRPFSPWYQAITSVTKKPTKASTANPWGMREDQERRKQGVIPGSLHVPYPEVAASLKGDGPLQQLAKATSKQLIFYCAFGERSAMAVQAAQAAGLTTARHIHGGMQAWRRAQGPIAS